MVLRVLNKVEEAVISLLLLTTTLLVFMDVVMRFGFNTGYIWTQELTLHMSAWFVLFGTSYGIKVGSHIGVDAFVKLFSRGIRRLITFVACLLSLCYCGLVLYGSWIYLSKMKKIGIELEDLPLPTWLAHGMLLVGFFFISVRILILLGQVIFGDADGFRHVDEAKESMEIVAELKEEEVQA